MGKKSKVPKAPDYSAIAAKQTAANKNAWQENLNANRANQNTAFGSTTWEQDESGNWTQNTSLAPEYEAIRKQQAGIQGDLAGKQSEMLGGLDTSQIDLGGAPAMPTVGGYNQQVIDTLRQLQSPELARSRSNKEAKLAAMGLGTGSGQAWNTEQGNISDAENRADLNAIMAGIEQGNTEFGQGMDLHQQGVSDILGERAANLGQLSGLMGLGQNVTNPTFDDYYTSGAYQTGDQMQAQQAAYNAALNKTNASNADKSSDMGALGTIGGIAASF